MTPRPSSSQSSVVEVVRHLSPAPRGARARARVRRRGLTYVEVLVIIGLIAIAVAFLLPSMQRTNCGGNRVKCASNLRQIGQAILLYSNDNKGAYPRALYASGPSVIPTWGTPAPAPNDVSAAMFLLLRTQDITPEVFTCPSSNTEKWDFGGGSNTALNHFNWTDVKKNLSYSYQNVYPDDAAAAWMNEQKFSYNNSISAEFAVAADINPGLKNGPTSNVFTVTTTSSAKDMKAANSPNHEGDGQNVLYGDGHVSFEQNPFVGVQRDNIYTAKSSTTAFSGTTFLASPFDGNDSVLLPVSE